MTIEEFVEKNHTGLKKLLFDKNEELKKIYFEKWWSEAINYIKELGHSYPLSKSDHDLICVMIEVISLYIEQLSIYRSEKAPPSLKDIQKAKYDIFSSFTPKFISKRERIVGKWFNLDTNQVEYELENGMFVPADSTKKSAKLEIDKSSLPRWLLSLVSPQVYRQVNLQQLLEDEDR